MHIGPVGKESVVALRKSAAGYVDLTMRSSIHYGTPLSAAILKLAILNDKSGPFICDIQEDCAAVCRVLALTGVTCTINNVNKSA